MKRQRDYQRSSVYKMDKDLGLSIGIDMYSTYYSMQNMEKIVKDLWANYPLIGSLPTVKDGRGRRKAGGCESYITMPKWARNPVVLAHELAHTLTRRYYGINESAHGARYVGFYRELLAIIADFNPYEFDKIAKQHKVIQISQLNHFIHPKKKGIKL